MTEDGSNNVFCLPCVFYGRQSGCIFTSYSVFEAFINRFKHGSATYIKSMASGICYPPERGGDVLVTKVPGCAGLIY